MRLEEYNEDGLMNLAAALLACARQDYDARIKSHDFLSARLQADYDSRGIVGYIVGYATGDHEFMKKEVEAEIKKERSKYYGFKEL